jgi:hypothetical protein
VEWPVLLTVGGAALLVRQLTSQSDGQRPAPPASAAAPQRNTPAKKAPAKRNPARKATSRRTASSRQS